MGDAQDRLDGIGESDDLSEFVASLGSPEVEDLPDEGDPEAAAVEPGDHVHDAEEPGSVDPEIAALQAELEAEPSIAEAEMVAPVAVAPEVAEAAEDDAVAVAPEPAPAESFDDIAPGTVAGVQEAVDDTKSIALPDDRPGVPLWPFAVYFALWVVFAGLLVWQSLQAPAGTPIYELDLYGISVLAGLILTALGPLLAIAVWLAVWTARPGARSGLFSRSLIIGALTTLAGVALWLIALGAVDMLRLGRML